MSKLARTLYTDALHVLSTGSMQDYAHQVIDHAVEYVRRECPHQRDWRTSGAC